VALTMSCAGVLYASWAGQVASLARWPGWSQLMHLIRQLQVAGVAWLAAKAHLVTCSPEWWLPPQMWQQIASFESGQ
jgi:hypothetical protein